MIDTWTNRARGKKALHLNANILWSMVGKLIYAGSRGGLLIMLAKLGNAEMVGQFALAFAITTPIFMLADLNLRSVYATDVHDRFEFGHYLGLRVSTTVVSMVIIAIIAAIQSNRAMSMIILLVGLARSFETMSDMTFGLYQRQQRLDRLGRSLILKGVLSVSLMGALLWLSRNLPLAVAGLAMAWIAVFIIYDYQNMRRCGMHGLKFSYKQLWSLMRVSLPLGVVLLVISLNNNVINYMIEGMISVEALGYYASIIYLMIVGSTFVSTLGQATNTKLATLYKNGHIDGFVKLILKMLGLVALAGMMAILVSAVAGKQILTILYDASYGDYQNVMVIVMIGAGLMYLSDMLNFAVTAIQKFKIQPILYGGVLLVGAAFNYLLISRWGLMGAATGLIMIYLMQFVSNAAVLIYALNQKRAEVPSMQAHDIEIVTCDSVYDMDNDVKEAWERLLEDNQNDSPFCRPQFIEAWEDSYSKEYSPLIVVAKDKGVTVGICPLCYQSNFLGHVVHFAGYPHATHMDAVIRSGYEEQVMQGVVEALEAKLKHYCLHLVGFKATSSSLQALHVDAITHRIPFSMGETVLPILDIQGKSWDELYSGIYGRKSRKKDRQRINRLKFLGDISFRKMEIGELEDVYKLHDKRWEKKCDTSGFTNDKGRQFFTQLIKLGLAEVYGLYVGDHLISFEYILTCRGRCLLLRSSHSGLCDVYTVGLLVDQYMIKHCCDAQLNMVDFGIGYEPYKMRWKPEMRKSKCILISGGSYRSRLLTGIKKMIKCITERAKQSRKIVMLRRNTLGKIRYALSKKHLKEVIGRIKRRMDIHGMSLIRWPWDKDIYIYHVHDRRDLCFRPSNMVDTLDLSDVEELSDLMLCDVQTIMKRCYIRHQCYVMKRDGKILCCAWAHKQDLPHHDALGLMDSMQGHAIYDIAYAQNTQQSEVTELISHVCHTLYREKKSRLYLRVNVMDERHMGVKDALGFMPGIKNQTMSRKAKKRGLR